jgi:LysM repeat protein
VEEGDVLWQIAERFSLRSETLVWANDLVNADLLQIGQKLLIPPVDGVFYTVQPGDHLADVATRYGVELDSIVAANGPAAATLTAGEDIFLPGARPLRRSTMLVEAPPADPAQLAAALPPIALPDDIGELRAAGWVRTSGATALFRTADPNARALQEVPAGVRLERLEGFSFGRIEVRDPGDGRTRQAMTGWVTAMDLDVGTAPRAAELPQAYPMDTAMDIAHVFAPYRTQLDGAPYAEANCGPVAVGMALEAFGISVASGQLRREVQAAQGMYGNHIGSLITALAGVVETHGLQAHGLHNASGGIERWTVDDIAQQITLGRPVIVQVRYRSLPGRGGAYYYGDHYILVTGVVPGGFLYNDPINHDGIGWDRFIPAGRLATAMDASDRRYAYAAFSVSR